MTPPLIELTVIDQGQRPLAVNPAHIVSVRPRSEVTADTTSQNPGVVRTATGALIQLVTGTHLNIVEDYGVVVEKIQRGAAPAPKAK
jgi:hypothetical protein